MLPSLTCRSVFSLNKNGLSQKGLPSKRFSTLNIKVLPHRFGIKAAFERFKEVEDTRFFDVSPYSGSFKQVFVPFYGYRAFVSETSFTAKVGFEIAHISYRFGSRYPQNRIEWQDVKGSIPSFQYPETGIYAGLQWDRQLVEGAFDLGAVEEQNYKIFQPSQVDPSIDVDPIKKRQKMASKLFKERLESLETDRLEAYLKRKFKTPFVHIQRLVPYYTCLKPNIYMLPGFILDQGSHSLRVMSAQDDSLRLSGSAPLSAPKIFLGISAITTLVTSLFSGLSVEFQMATALTLASSGAFGAKLKQSLASRSSVQRIATDERDNSSFEETVDDKLLFMESKTSKAIHSEKNLSSLEVADEYYKILGLSKDQSLSREIIREAFFCKMQENYSREGSQSGDECRRLIKARQVFYRALNEQENH